MKTKTKILFYFHFRFCFCFCFSVSFLVLFFIFVFVFVFVLVFMFIFVFDFVFRFHFRFCFHFCFYFCFLVSIFKFYCGTSRPPYRSKREQVSKINKTENLEAKISGNEDDESDSAQEIFTFSLSSNYANEIPNQSISSIKSEHGTKTKHVNQ